MPSGMSSPAAGKFQDHYKILGIDPKASTDVVQMAYNALRNIYDTSVGTEPSHEKMDEITLALEVLMDPQGRKMFDSVRGGNDDDREVKFSGMVFFSELTQEQSRRLTMLCVLYDVRRQNPRVPMVTMRQFEKVVDMTENQIQMSLWYLKTLSYVSVDDKSKMQITAQGMEFLEENPPDAARIWPFLKNPGGEQPEAAVEAPVPVPEPVVETRSLSSLSSVVAALTPKVEVTAPVEVQPRPKTISLIRRTHVAITEA